MAVSALTAYSVVDDYRLNVVLVALAYLAVGLPGSGSWALLGSAMRRALSNPTIARLFNLTMALLLLASIVPVLAEK